MRNRRVTRFILMYLFFAGPALAQSLPGLVGVFSDGYAASDCNFVDDGSLVYVYVFHVGTNGATGVQFKLDVESTGWTYLGENWPYALWIGRSIDGVSCPYGACLSGTIQLCTVMFFGSNAPSCTYIGIVPDPAAGSGEIEALDCADPPKKMFPHGGLGIVNPTAGCTCIVPAEETTWGGVKALYR